MRNCILTLGKFESIHRGHRALLSQVASRAKAEGIPSVVAVFSPHPIKFLRIPDYKPLFTDKEREEMVKNIGIDKIITYNFDENFANMSAEDFCREIKKLNPLEIIVGENYRFGKNRKGTIETLRNYGFTVYVVKNVSNISTSRIREFLIDNDFETAENLLSFPFFVSGVVTKGRQLGRVLGFPTMNIYPPQDKFLPINGVYETVVSIDGVERKGITNIGVRPTITNEQKISVETHIPNIDGEMYGRHIKVEFKRFLRRERCFENTEELVKQIRKDIGGNK